MKLTDHQWRTVSALLDQVLDLAPPQRGAWFAQQHGLEPELRCALRGMFEHPAETETAEFLRTLARLPSRDAPDLSSGLRAGDIVGAYRLVSELGRGGMGSVWLAERGDSQLKRPVALKLPHPSLEPGLLKQRYARERDILAALNHPNIARLYDAGLTASGQPFLALEYVQGRTLLDEFAARNLGLRQRLDLFEQVLEAVKYAHARLVVHRDLKPSNILVTEDGQVRLLDFGIAKLLVDGDGSETELTRVGGRAMTPDYASPEQILGQPITTAADVYSLGVLLFELLCGQRPYRLRRGSQAALEEAILTADPPAPSELAVDRNLARELRGDLDTIALKALKKKPEQRYESAAALAEDLRRYRASLPVLAQPDTRWYRWHRFLVRNWIPVSAVAGVFITMAAGAGVALWQASSARQAQARADEVKKFIASIFTDTRPATGKGGMAGADELLARASERVPRELVANPRVAAELDRIIGEGLSHLGAIDRAREHLEQAIKRDATALGQRDPEVLRLKVLLADIYMNQGNVEAAEPMLTATAAELRSIGREGAGDLIQVLHDLAEVQWGHGGDQGLITASEAVEVADKWLAADDPQRLLALSSLGENLRVRNRFAEALPVVQRSAELARRLFGSQRPNEILARAQCDLAYVLSFSDRPAEAAALARSGLADISALHGANSIDVAWGVLVLGRALSQAGQLKEAEDYERRYIQIETAAASGPSINVAIAHQRLAQTLLEARRPDEALGQMRIADEITTAAGRRISPSWAHDMLLDRAEALIGLGRIEEATTLIDSTAKQLGKDPRHLWARVAQLQAQALRLSGRARDAVDPATAAVRRAQDQREGPRTDASLRVALAQALLESENAQAARELMIEASARYQTAQLGPSPRVADALVGRGRAELALGNAASALQTLKQAHDFWLQFDPDNIWAAEAAAWYGRAQLASGRIEEGRALIAQSRARLRSSRVPLLQQLAAASGSTTVRSNTKR